MKRKLLIQGGFAFVILLAIAFGVGVGQAYATTGCFTDTNGSWAETAICWLSDNGITSGTSPGIYSPNANVTRAQMAVFLQKLNTVTLTQANAYTDAALATGTITKTYAGIEFRPGHSELTFAPYGMSIYALAIPAGGQSFKRTLDLPNGANIIKLTILVVDNDPTNNIIVQISRNNPSTNSQYLPVSVYTTNDITGTGIQTITVIGSVISPLITIDNATNAYALRYAPVITGSNHMLVAARVEYTLSGPSAPEPASEPESEAP